VNKLKTITIALYAGVAAVFIGLITFTLSWHFYDFLNGPIPGYNIFLYPANQTLIYVWHPLFTEEVDLLPKLGLMLFGQFVVVTCAVRIFTSIVRKLLSVRTP
jgi:hypothetical protein